MRMVFQCMFCASAAWHGQPPGVGGLDADAAGGTSAGYVGVSGAREEKCSQDDIMLRRLAGRRR